MKKLLAAGRDSSTITRVSHKGLEKRAGESTPGDNNTRLKEITFLVRRRIKDVIFKERPGPSCWTIFCIKICNSNESFQISHDCETENVDKIFGKICLKAITDTFCTIYSL